MQTTKTIIINGAKKNYSVAPGKNATFFLFQGLLDAHDYNVTIKLHEESRVTVYGLAIGNKSVKLRTDLEIIHAEPKAQSHVILKGVYTDSAQGILNGNIIIKPQAQQTNARLEERVLLLSPDAYAETIPNLEIEADDVKAAHAATISKISDDEIFYLQTRGVPRNHGEQLIIEAFLSSQFTHLPKSELRAMLVSTLRKKLKSLTI